MRRSVHLIGDYLPGDQSRVKWAEDAHQTKDRKVPKEDAA